MATGRTRHGRLTKRCRALVDQPYVPSQWGAPARHGHPRGLSGVHVSEVQEKWSPPYTSCTQGLAPLACRREGGAQHVSRLLHCGQACGGGSTDAAHRQLYHPPALGPWRLSRSIVSRSAVKGTTGCMGSGTRWLALNGVSCTCRLYARTSNVSRLMTSVVL